MVPSRWRSRPRDEPTAGPGRRGDGNLYSRSEGQLQRAGATVDGRFEALALEQPAHLPRHSVETLDRLGELEVVESLGERRAPCTEPQHEPVGRDFRKAGGEHGDGGRRAPPDVQDPRAEGDLACPRRNLGEEHARVMSPAFGHEERVVPQGFRAIGQVQHDRTPCLHGCQSNGKLSSGHHSMILECPTDVQAPTGRAEGGPGPASCVYPPPVGDARSF